MVQWSTSNLRLVSVNLQFIARPIYSTVHDYKLVYSSSNSQLIYSYKYTVYKCTIQFTVNLQLQMHSLQIHSHS